MLIRKLLVIIACMCVLTVHSYLYSWSISDCITYESDTSKKWCRYSTSTTQGYGCSFTETSSVCGGNSTYICSSDSSYLPQNSKKLLCPHDSSSCNLQTYTLYKSTSKALYSNYFGSSTFCWYKFTPTSSYTDKMTIKINSLVNANAEVYYESPTKYYTYKGSLSSGGSMDVSVSYYDPVWVLVIPSSSSAYVNVTATTNNSYSSSSSDDSHLVAIIVPTVVGGTFFIICIVIIIVCSIIRRRKMLQYQNNMVASAVAHPVDQAPQPQLYYPPQQNYSVGNADQSVMPMGIQQPTYPNQLATDQNVYIIEPIPRTSEPIPYEPAYPVPSNSVYVGQGIPVSQNIKFC